MKKAWLFLKKCKKAFTLMECVCAIAVVALLSALILPLTAAAIKSMRTSDSLRQAAVDASKKNATTQTYLTGSKKNVETVYVTVAYTNVSGLSAESAFVFTKSEATGSDDVKVTYYDMKYHKETEDAK